MLMLVVDTALYGLLAAWLDNVLPTEYGTRRPAWFCLQPSYWRSGGLEVEDQQSALPPLDSQAHIESPPAALVSSPAVQIRNLRKVFTKGSHNLFRLESLVLKTQKRVYSLYSILYIEV